MTDETFLQHVTSRLATLPGVQAVTLGGSRAQGTHTPDSDWDLAIYYRETLDPNDLRELGWPGEVSELGGWGGGVFNGGAWFTIDDHQVDVHYRDLDVVEHELAEAEQGRFHWEPLMFHLAGIPSYLVVAELAINQIRHGTLPRPTFPQALRRTAAQFWHNRATMTLHYAKTTYAPRGQSTEVAATLAIAAMQTAHAVLAARGEWTTNEKRLLHRAGLRDIDTILTTLNPNSLPQAIIETEALLRSAILR
ncbi:nucleotidyltransferase domain-containing protein [Nocardia sp. NBC_01499]|uniref:nucleotidyltransferase domain-containing protein n=1 Tax=Nocardia sp. NBC_01499 TaxID=2903597 RepID=UPI003869B579